MIFCMVLLAVGVGQDTRFDTLVSVHDRSVIAIAEFIPNLIGRKIRLSHGLCTWRSVWGMNTAGFFFLLFRSLIVREK